MRRYRRASVSECLDLECLSYHLVYLLCVYASPLLFICLFFDDVDAFLSRRFFFMLHAAIREEDEEEEHGNKTKNRDNKKSILNPCVSFGHAPVASHRISRLERWVLL